MAVHEDNVYWFARGTGSSDRPFFQVPLHQLLEDEDPLPPLPDWLKGSHKTLCIMPDHWFGSQSFPFQSTKASLIEPFLERKLTEAVPGRKSIRHFFNYRHIGDGSRRKLSAFYFQEDMSYQLYEALSKLNHTPQHITAPAFLWEDLLQRATVICCDRAPSPEVTWEDSSWSLYVVGWSSSFSAVQLKPDVPQCRPPGARIAR